jgi:hypothetical protein
MKSTIIALLTMSALAAPALAHANMRAAQSKTDSLYGAQAQAMPSPTAIYAKREPLGADPDPQVRLQFSRSAGFLDR